MLSISDSSVNWWYYNLVLSVNSFNSDNSVHSDRMLSDFCKLSIDLSKLYYDLTLIMNAYEYL